MSLLNFEDFQGQTVSQCLTFLSALTQYPGVDVPGASGPIAQLEEPPAHNR